jgi:hypothetical protein
MLARLTVYCRGRDREGGPTHDRTVVADLGIDEQVGIVLMPTAQQRGNPEAGRPRAFGELLDCPLCDFCVPAGKRPHKGLRRVMVQCRDAGLRELSLYGVRRALDRRALDS